MEKQMEQGLFDGGEFGMSCDEDEHKLNIEKAKLKQRTMNPEYECYEWYSYLRDLLSHRLQVTKSSIDDADPLVPTTFPMSYNAFNHKLANYMRHERENAVLLKNIQKTFARKTYPDTKLNPTSHYIHTKAIHRERQIFKTMFQNIALFRRLRKIKPVITRKKQLEDFEKHHTYLRRICNFPIYNESRICAPHEVVARKRVARFPRDRIYFDVEVEDKMAGRIVVELYSDVTPMASENFRCLMLGVRKESYKCVTFDKVIPNLLWRANTGRVNSIYGYPFPAENFKIKHDTEGLISMPAYGKRGIRSEFIITLRKLQCLDGFNVVVGRVIYGMEFIKKATHRCKPSKSSNGTPAIPVMLMKCGEVSDMIKAASARPVLFKEILEQVIRARLAADDDNADVGHAGEDHGVEEVHDFTPTSSYSGGDV